MRLLQREKEFTKQWQSDNDGQVREGRYVVLRSPSQYAVACKWRLRRLKPVLGFSPSLVSINTHLRMQQNYAADIVRRLEYSTTHHSLSAGAIVLKTMQAARGVLL
jgi:hypothetical protein